MQLAIQPKYKPGQRFALEVEERKPERHVVTHVGLRVLRVEADGFLLLWQPQWTEVLEIEESEIEVDPELAEKLDGLGLELAFDQTGRWIGISNEIEVMEVLGPLVNSLLESSGQAEEIAAILTPEFCLAKLKKPLAIYFAISGRVLNVGEKRSGRGKVPNAAGGGLAEVQLTIQTEALADGNLMVRVEQRTEARSTFEMLAERGGVVMPDSYLECEMVDLSEYTVDGARKLVRNLRFYRKLDHPEVQEGEFWEIRMV